ncbi:hypothetical protein ACFX13_039461 [Malus domestica]
MSSSSSLTKTAHGLISICLITLLAFLAVDGRCLELAHLNGTEHQSVVDHFHGVVANVTVGGFNFQLNLSNPKLVEELNIKRSDFPSDFLFGAGTATGQTEGSAKGGRGPSHGNTPRKTSKQYKVPYGSRWI